MFCKLSKVRGQNLFQPLRCAYIPEDLSLVDDELIQLGAMPSILTIRSNQTVCVKGQLNILHFQIGKDIIEDFRFAVIDRQQFLSLTSHFLNLTVDLNDKETDKTRIHFVHDEEVGIFGADFDLTCPILERLMNTPVVFLVLNGIGKNILNSLRRELFKNAGDSSLRRKMIVREVLADRSFNGFFASHI